MRVRVTGTAPVVTVTQMPTLTVPLRPRAAFKFRVAQELEIKSESPFRVPTGASCVHVSRIDYRLRVLRSGWQPQ